MNRLLLRALLVASSGWPELGAARESVAAAASAVVVPSAAAKTYAVNSLIIPTDTDFQDAGMLKAYGLVFKLLANGVPVDWVIRSSKAVSTIAASPSGATESGTTATFTTTSPHNLSVGEVVQIVGVGVPGYNGSRTVASVVSGTQFTATLGVSGLGASGSGTVTPADLTAEFRNIKTATTGTHAYRAGPFVIDAPSRAAALPIVQAWQTANPSTTVHEATAPFTANVGRSLVAAPRLALFDDGNAGIAFSYLKAAGIPDSAGNAWTATSPDLLTPLAVAGATTTNHRDGALFDSNGVPLFSLLLSMHYNATGVNTEAVAETTEFLKSRTLFFAECQAVIAFENTAHFLTDQSFTVKAQPATAAANFSDQPVAQMDGAFGTVGGSEPAFAPTGVYLGTEGTDYFRIVRGPSLTPTSDIVILGNAFQNGAAGRVVYLGGHQYTAVVPISTNPKTQGVRSFLNALLFAPSTAIGDGLADLTLTLNGPTSSMTAANDYTVTYQNSGTGVCLGTQITVPIPAGMTASMISGGGAISSGQIVWNLGNLDAGKPAPAGTLGFRLTASGFGNYTVSATGGYKRGLTPAIASRTVTTSYAPDITQMPALNTPASGTVTKSPITVAFSLPEAALSGSVRLIFDAGGTPRTLTLAPSQETSGAHSFSFNPANPIASTQIASGGAIADGSYTVTLSYQDMAGNLPASASATNVTVDTTGPNSGTITMVPSSPVDASAALMVSFAGWTDPTAPLTYALLVDDAVISAKAAALSRDFAAPSTPGPHSLKGRIYDALDNVTEVTENFTVNTEQESWRKFYFGTTANTGDAADLADPDGDGNNNFFEYVSGLVPTDPKSRFSVRVEAVAGQMSQRAIVFLPLVEGRTYRVKSKSALTDTTWIPLDSFSTSDNGVERTVIDRAALAASKFYIVEITRQ